MSSLATDLLLDPFDARWPDVLGAAEAAQQAGFDGIWTWDHLAGQVHGAQHVLESWTILSALAARVDRITLGPLVLNVANRDPGLVALMAATLQDVSRGRLLRGLGAGGSRHTPYALEQRAFGRRVPSDPVRRRQVEDAVRVIRQVWSGQTRPLPDSLSTLAQASGFLRPDPVPPIIIGAFGPGWRSSPAASVTASTPRPATLCSQTSSSAPAPRMRPQATLLMPSS